MSSNVDSSDAKLEKLSDSGLMLDDPAQDIRNRRVIDSRGSTIGHVSAIFIDEDERKVRILELRVGDVLGIGGSHVLLPVDAIKKVTLDNVYVDVTREHVLKSPAFDPLLVARERGNWNPYYGYYGYLPYWDFNYRYPSFGIWP
jgi:sporulation protein YlmC with PRC-barrel domain